MSSTVLTFEEFVHKFCSDGTDDETKQSFFAQHGIRLEDEITEMQRTEYAKYLEQFNG